MLLKVKGVGAKIALAILSTMTVADFQHCLAHEDSVTLKKIPGVGDKTAKQIILDLRDKFDKEPVVPGTAKVTVDANPRSEAVDALVALGYKATEVNKLIGSMDVDGQTAEDIIRQALRQAAR